MLRRSDEYTRWPTCHVCKAANSKKPSLVLAYEKLAESLLLVVICYNAYVRPLLRLLLSLFYDRPFQARTSIPIKRLFLSKSR